MTDKIKNKLENGYTIDTLALYKDTFETFKKMVLPAALIMFLVGCVVMCLYTFLAIAYYQSPQEAVKQLESFNILQLENHEIAIYICINTALNALLSVVGAGFIAMAKNVSVNKLPTIGTVLQYLISLKGLKIFATMFVIQALLNMLSLYLQIISLDFVSLFCLFLMHALTLLFVPLIIFENLSISKALTASIRLVNQQPLKIFFLLFFMGSFAFGGIFLFLIGILATFPLLYAFIFQLYEHIINKN